VERRSLILGGLLAATLAAGGWWWSRDRAVSASVVERLVPDGTRIRVEVLNASEVRGLARRATFVLRDAGFDVVRFTGDDARRAENLVIDRTGHPDWARLASQALGGATIESRPDSGRYVDLTVLVGARWRPPAQPFNP
jgi:LytR cell envelope-related transcriptional attenuator